MSGHSTPAIAAALFALPAAAALAQTAGGACVASAASERPALLSCTGARLVRPSGTVILFCADANSEFRATHWRTWSADRVCRVDGVASTSANRRASPRRCASSATPRSR